MPYPNALIAELFGQVADALELEAANPFRVRAYRNAARLVRGLARPVAVMLRRGEDLAELPGIGPDLAGKMREIALSGRLGLLERLRRGPDARLLQLLQVPDLGPKRARILHAELGVGSLADLKAAAKAGRIRALPGFGPALERKLLAHLGLAGSASRRLPRAQAGRLARALQRHMAGLKGLRRMLVAGSYRRQAPDLGDLDLLVCADDAPAALRRFLAYPGRVETVAQGSTRAAFRLADGFQVDLRVVPVASFGAALLYFTGSKAHNVLLRSRARRRGLKLNEYGLYRGAVRVAGRSEEEVYAALGLRWIPPQRREGLDEIREAELKAGGGPLARR